MTLRKKIPRLVLHCGANKTGTTAIQAACNSHRASLEQSGILYPNLSIADIKARSHFPLAVAFHESPEKYYVMKDLKYGESAAKEYCKQVISTFDAQLAATTCDTVLVSSEAIGMLNPGSMASLCAFLEERFDDINAVYYGRPPIPAVMSFLQHEIQAGNPGSVASSVNGPNMSFGGSAQRLQHQFGDRLALRIFDRDKLHNGDILSDLFYSGFGKKTLPAGVKSGDTNVALSAKATAFLFFMNREVSRRGAAGINPVFTQVRVVAESYMRKETTREKLKFPSASWEAAVRQSLADDFQLFLSLANMTEEAIAFSRQLEQDARNYPFEQLPEMSAIAAWMREIMTDFRYDWLPQEFADILRRCVEK